MFDLFMAVMRPVPSSSILDLGVTPDRSLPESNFFEQVYPYPHGLTAASIEDASFLEQLRPGLRFVRIAPGPLPFAEDEFDVVFCSAVIEHVGSRVAQRSFIEEILRVGRTFFITTPNRRFPVDFHTLLPVLHWLPQAAHQAVLRRLGLEFWAQTENLNLLTPRGLAALFPSGVSLCLCNYRLLGWPANIIAYGRK